MEIKEERGPSGGLMLRDGGNNGNVFLGISGIQKSHTSSTPFSFSGNGEINETESEGNNDTSEKKSGQQLETGLGNMVSDKVHKHISLFIIMLFSQNSSYL